MRSSVGSYSIKKEKNGVDGGSALSSPPGFNNIRSNSNNTPPNVEEDPSPLPTTRKRGRPPKKTAPSPPKPEPIICAEPTIELIKAKYGDIEKDCDLKSEVMRKVVVSGICDVLKELHNLKIEELNVGSLDKYYAAVKDAEKLKIDVKWLRQQLDRLKEAIGLNVRAKRLLTERDEQRNKLIKQEEELKALKTRKQKLVTEMIMATTKISCLDRDIASGTIKFEHFKGHGMLDGLFN